MAPPSVVALLPLLVHGVEDRDVQFSSGIDKRLQMLVCICRRERLPHGRVQLAIVVEEVIVGINKDNASS